MKKKENSNPTIVIHHKSIANHHKIKKIKNKIKKKNHKPTITDPYSSSYTSHSLPLPPPPSDPHLHSSLTNPPPRKSKVPPPSPLHLHRLISPTPLSAPPPSKATISTQSPVVDYSSSNCSVGIVKSRLSVMSSAITESDGRIDLINHLVRSESGAAEGES